MPGEENVQLCELYVFAGGDDGLTKVEADKWTDQTLSNVHWTGEGHEKLRFVRRDRLQRNLELCEYDMETAEIKVLITESVEDAALERGSARYVGENNTGDILWWSERNGWGHFYLYTHDGEFKNVITSGTWGTWPTPHCVKTMHCPWRRPLARCKVRCSQPKERWPTR